MALNGLLFLPFYLLHLNEGTSLHILSKLREAPHTALFNIFIWREHSDPFRINSELAIMLALWVNVGWLRRGAVRWLMTSLYFIALLYYAYESIMIYLYRDDPVFYNHYFLIRDGLRFLAENLNISTLVYFLVFIGTAVIIAIIFFILRTLVDGRLPTQLSRTTRLGLTALALSVLLCAATYRDVSADPRMVISSLSFKLEKNITASVALYHSILNFDDTKIYTTYNYARHRLAKKPNIYLIFIESYGSVLYKRPDWRVAYIDMLHKAENQLQDGGFHFASAFSKSPTWGGGSWLAYTSALFGLHLENHPQYLTLMERYQTKVPRYPDLGTYLRNQGYYYFWTTSISDQLGDKKWTSYKTFYGVDEWLRYDDLAYDGPRYGWGPAPPDQYTLAYTRDVAMQDIEQPLAMFYITQNSHFPYQTLPTMTKDWRDLNSPPLMGDPIAEEGISHAQLRANYLSAIEYQLEMLTDFILNHANEDAVFVLVGDHQPPSVSRRADGYETPVHIISLDPNLIANLEQFGFVQSMVIPDEIAQDKTAQNEPIQVEKMQEKVTQDEIVQDEIVPLRHEGLYSLLVRTLVQTYGGRPYDAPQYLPDGVTPPDWIIAQSEESTE